MRNPACICTGESAVSVPACNVSILQDKADILFSEQVLFGFRKEVSDNTERNEYFSLKGMIRNAH